VILIADGTVQTSGVTVRIKPIGVSEADGGGTVAYSTNGIIIYTPTQAETNYTSFVLIATKASCIPASITVITTASATPGTVLLAPVTHTSAVVPTVTNLTNPSLGTNAPTNWINAAAIAADAIGADEIAAGAVTKIQTGLATPTNITAATGVTLAPTTGFGTQTGTLSTVTTTGTATNVTTVNGLAANAITATSIAADAITAAKIADGAIDAATFAADVDAEILSYLVDDATRIDASALNTASGTTVPAISTEVGKIPKSATALTSGQVRHSIAGGSAANITIGPHV
jgi:hypothetical protein